MSFLLRVVKNTLVGFSKWLFFVHQGRACVWWNCFRVKAAHLALVVLFWGSILKIMLHIGNKSRWRNAFILFWLFFRYYSIHILLIFHFHFFRHISWPSDDIRFLRSLERALHESEGLISPQRLKRSENFRGGFPKSSSGRGGGF